MQENKKPIWKLNIGKTPNPEDLPKDIPTYEELQRQVAEMDGSDEDSE